jgi:hypothetical protein
VVGVDHRDIEFTQQRDKRRRLEAVVPYLDDMTKANNSRKPPKSASSNFLNGANCQSSGPSLPPSSVTPDSRNRVMDSLASLSTRRLVT